MAPEKQIDHGRPADARQSVHGEARAPAMKWKDDPPHHIWPQLLALTENAIAHASDSAAIWTRFAQSALALGKEQEAIDPLIAAVTRMPASLLLRCTLARLLSAVDRLEEARLHLDEALRIDAADRSARLLDFGLLVKERRWDEAIAQRDAVIALNRCQPQLLEVCWRAASDSAGLLDVLALCDSILAEQPGHANAAYFRALALAKLGRDDDARSAMATDRIVEIVDLPVPVAFADGDAFRAALREEVLGNPTLIRNPRGKAIREGARTRGLRRPDAPAVEALIVQIEAAVEAYAERRSAQSSAFARSVPSALRLSIWASILGADGFQRSHRHVSGWLSGVYYVNAPRLPGESSYRGALLLGALDAQSDKIDPPWEVLRIEPVPGRLVLFPSCAPHATEPTGVDGERISIAFDVIAA